MAEIKLACNKCKKGNLKVIELLHDDYHMGCDTCSNEFSVHYTGFDSMMEQAEYDSQINDDVLVLRNNGSWVYDGNYKAEKFDFGKFTKGMKLIHTIESYETTHFYQKGASFFMVEFNAIHQAYKICTYRANEEGLPTLMKHFFKNVA